MLDRETQIELMKTARERHDALVKRLMDDPKVRAMLTRRDENDKEKVHPAAGCE